MSESISEKKLVDGYRKACIDSSIESNPAYSPLLVSNSTGQKVLSEIEKELRGCDDMFISVAFITMGGIAPLLGTLKELEQRGTKGRIITTDYLMFSEPRALDTLSSLSNVDLRVFKTIDNNVGFHTKGYMFHNNGNLRIIVGSSNLTQNAITKNHEWNTRLVSTTDGQYAKDIENAFNVLWNSSVCYNDYRDEYTDIYAKSSLKRAELKSLTYSLDLSYAQVLQPNSMQEQFTCNIEEIVHAGGKRALLISATGTGKTYASAFALRKMFSDNLFDNKKALFLSHREQINKQALNSFKRIFGNGVSMELLSGNHNDIQKVSSARFIFSTMNMMAKEEIRSHFDPEHFSIIILDECHRSGSESYQKIIDHFKPSLLLGMSASPERRDNFDVFSLFDHNIACEIRLQQALENDMLCPFHYFGITDIEIDGKSDELNVFRHLTSKKRVDYIIKRAEYYGFSGDRVKGLIFCSRKEEAKELSIQFNNTGKYRTIALSGDNSQEERENAIERLVSDDVATQLDYIFTVDIFNEGVDIPEINQVIMLRPTESPIVFVQQLGRGLRKSDGKEFVIILDFIGNYQNNYMIPIALGGDRTGNKDNIRRYLMEGNSIIKGASTIYFDEISKERIYNSIDSANLNQIQTIKKDYQNLKYKVGRIPFLKEFDEMGELDPLRIIDKCGSYQNFLKKYDSDYNDCFTKDQYGILEFVSTKFASGMRAYELSLLKILVNIPDLDYVDLWEKNFENAYGVKYTDIIRNNIRSVLSNSFFRGKQISPNLIDIDSHYFKPSKLLLESVSDLSFKKALNEVIDFGLYRNKRDYSNNYQGTSFNLYKKYTYQEVCWLLNWQKEEVSLNIGGYKLDKYSMSYPIFINYDKAEDVGVTTNYEDRFEDQSTLTAISKSKRTLNSDDVQNAIHTDENGILMPLFVRKNKNDETSKEFYFLGTIVHNGYTEEFIMPNTDGVRAVKIGYRLKTPVESNLYEYITE